MSTDSGSRSTGNGWMSTGSDRMRDDIGTMSRRSGSRSTGADSMSVDTGSMPVDRESRPVAASRCQRTRINVSLQRSHVDERLGDVNRPPSGVSLQPNDGNGQQTGAGLQQSVVNPQAGVAR
jgi:hypothetical protein